MRTKQQLGLSNRPHTDELTKRLRIHLNMCKPDDLCIRCRAANEIEKLRADNQFYKAVNDQMMRELEQFSRPFWSRWKEGWR